MATVAADGRTRLDQLPRQAALAGWPTTTATDEIAALRAEKAALEKVAEAAQKLSIYHPNFFELHDALREAGYLGGGE